MFAQSRSPEKLLPTELDAYLAQGWFRMGQTIFTTNFVRFKGNVFSTIWLRVLLNEYVPDATQIKLFKRNAIFKTTVQPALLTPEKEELYLRYQQSLSFPTSESLQQLLMGDHSHSIYNTYEVTVCDNGKLIAVGFFDLGETSAAGIVSVYDPDYKKYSLGKYLIYQKMQFCQQRKLTYFYPGYFVPGNPSFDYKLSIGHSVLQFLQLRSQHWRGIGVFSPDCIPYHVMQEKLVRVQKLLPHTHTESKVINYEYFDANLIPDLREAELLDVPVFLFYPNESAQDLHYVIVFDIRDARYHLQACFPFWKPDVINPDPTLYSEYVLKMVYDIHATDQPEEIAAIFLKSIEIKS